MSYFLLYLLQIIDPLPPIDHSEIEYEAFNKNFYEEHEEIAKLLFTEVNDLRNKLGIRVSSYWLLLASN